MKTENRLRTLLRISLLTLLFVLNCIPVWAQHQGVLTGKVLLEDKSAADFATVYLKGTSYGCMTDETEDSVWKLLPVPIRWLFRL